MKSANIHDPGTIERIYPRAVFEREANANARTNASVLNGVRILSSPDAGGNFELTRASRHVGEIDGGAGAIFLSPVAQKTAAGAAYPAGAKSPATAGEADESDGPYRAFIDKIIATARRAHFAPSPGPGDARLRGLRQ